MSPAQGATPTGAILPYAGEMSPEGYLLCNGAAINRTTYATLFGVIGETYGVGNGNTTFNLPDLRGRFPLGLDNMGGTSADRVTAAEADALNGSGGVDTHTLTVDEMPAHRHSLNIDNEGALPDWATNLDSTGSPDNNESRVLEVFNNQSNLFWQVSDDVSYPQINAAKRMPSHPMGVRGSSNSHNNMPPYLSLNYIIKT